MRKAELSASKLVKKETVGQDDADFIKAENNLGFIEVMIDRVEETGGW